jgi:hypothetical protein
MKSRAVVCLLAVGLLLGRSSFGVTQLINNGNFNGQGFWSFSPFATTQTGVSFNGSLSMGNTPGPQTQIVFQTVTISTNTILAQYSFSLSGSSSDAQGAAQFNALVVSTDSTTILTNLGVANNGNFGQAQDTFDLTGFAGQTVELTFETQLFAGATNSAFNVTGASLLAFTTNDIPRNDYFTNSSVLNNASNKISMLGTNILATREPGEPKILNNPGGHSLWWNWTAPSNGLVVINTSGSSFSTLLGVYTGASISNLTLVGANSSGGVNSQVKFVVSTGTTYQIAVDGRNGASGVVQLNVSFSADTKAPTVAITSPAANAKLTNSTVVVHGTASDNVAVGSVQYRLENVQVTNDYQLADGTNTWTTTVTNLIPGPNTIQVFATDTSGNQSAVVSRTVTFIVVSPLTVTTNGPGTVTPNLNGQFLDVGNNYTMTAKPGTGQVLSNWVGPDGVLATTPSLTFTMESNLMLTVNFVPNPFTPLTGIYQGLFYDTVNGPAHESSGFFNVTLASSGSFSAKVMVAGVSYSLSGQFSAGGVASNNIVRKGLPTVSVQMQLDLNGGGITGVLSDGTWTAQLNAEHVVSNAALAHYTLLIPGGEDGVEQPGGDGYGTVTVSATGGIAFGGALPDSTKISQKANLLANGQWAFYVPLYSGKGSIFGWLTFSNQVDSDITGTVDWFKLAGASGKFYPGGFTNFSEATGSIYLFTNGVPVLNFTNGDGQVAFSNGNLTSSFTNGITLSAANKITSTNTLTMAITTSSGLFKCTAVNPVTGKPIAGNGVVLQKQTIGGGFFLGTNQTGRVSLAPASP